MDLADDASRAMRGFRSGGPVPGTSLVVDNRPNWTYGNNSPAASAATDVPFKTVGGNPNVPPGGSKEAAAFRASQAAPTVPPVAEPVPTAKPGMSYRAGQAVGEAGRSLRGSVAPLLAAGGTVGAIDQASEDDSTARYAKRFATDEPTGDGSVGDIAKFVGLRAGGFASDLGANILDAGTAAVNGVRAKFGAEPIPTFRSLLFRDGDPRPASTAAPVTAQPAATPVQAAALRPTPQQIEASTTPANVVTRSGNSFSGSDVREGFAYGGDGAPNGARAGSTFNVMPGYDSSRDEAYSRNLRGMVEVQRGIDEFNRGAPGMGGFGSGGGTLRDMITSGKYTGNQIDALLTDQANQTALRGQNISAGNNAAQISQQRYNTDVGAQVSVRGQDNSSAIARLQARQQQMEKDRQYNLDVAKFGHEQAAQNFTQREAADKNVTAKLEALNPGADGKPNSAAVAEQKAYLDRGVADLGVQGFHELGPQAQNQLLSATKLLARIKQDGGLMPWKPDLLKTVSPTDLLSMEYDKQRDSYVITRKGSRALGQSIPARYFKREDAGYFFGAPTNQYDNLINGARDDGRQ